MAPEKDRRRVEAVFADIDDAAAAAAELAARGKDAWDEDRLLRLAGEAIIGRIADAAGRLPESVRSNLSDVPWDDIMDIRILVDHIYHRVDYAILWRTLTVDVPHLNARLREFRESNL
jgi:uncharacterized protein with HEPN domain